MSYILPLDDNSVRQYAQDLSKVQIVDAPTERKLFRQYKWFGDIDARNKLIESGLRFVVTVAQRYARDLEHQKALISAGNEGLLIAVERFKLNRKTRFLSYATWYVILMIREELHKAPVVPIPVWRKKSAKKVSEARAIIKENTGRDATDYEVAEYTGLSVNQIRNIEGDQHSIVSLDDSEGGTAILDGMVVEDSSEPGVINASGRELMNVVLTSMSVREKFIIQAYYGFIVDPPMSLKQIASILGISSERVRQVKMDALNKLQKTLGGLGIDDISDVLDV